MTNLNEQYNYLSLPAKSPHLYISIHSLIHDVLKIFAKHYVTGEVMPDSLLSKMILDIKNEIDEIAFFEFSSCHTSESLKNVLKNIKPNMTEFEVAEFYKPIGIPLSCHMMFSSGKRATLGLASPSSKVLNLGEPFAAAYGVWGALNCRVGWIANDEKDLPSDTKDYFEKLVVPYFKAVKAWYENLAIGVEGGLIFKEVMNILNNPFFGVYLNPGHLIHKDEWMNSPIYKNSKEKLT